MKTYIKFFLSIYLKSFLNIFLIMFSLVFILNILQEIEFLTNQTVSAVYPIYLSLLNTPSIIFEMFPFIFLIASQFFFIKLFNNNEINIFKYSGLKNFKIIYVLGAFSFVMGIIIIFVYYNLSSNLQGHYLEIKNRYSTDKSYLAVINKNGLWLRMKQLYPPQDQQEHFPEESFLGIGFLSISLPDKTRSYQVQCKMM